MQAFELTDGYHELRSGVVSTIWPTSKGIARREHGVIFQSQRCRSAKARIGSRHVLLRWT